MATEWTKPVEREVALQTANGTLAAIATLDEKGVSFRLKRHSKSSFVSYADLLNGLKSEPIRSRPK